MTPYHAALALADRCIPSFPCSASKAPLTPHGHLDATIEHDAATWRGAALVGVPTGRAGGGFDALDLDPRHGSEAWLAANAHRLPVTCTVHTRSGGVHMYFRSAPGLRGSAGRVAQGVDIRAEGSYVIDWQSAGLPVDHADDLADWPDWLLAEAMGARVRHAENSNRSNADIAPPNAEAVVALLDRLPNEDSTSRDTYLRIMLAAQGCADSLDSDGAEDIVEAAVGWAARWPGSEGYDAEREKWDADFSRRTAPISGWPQLLAAATRLGLDVSAERAADAAADFAGVRLSEPVKRGRRMRDRIVRPADCETGPRRGYVIKGLLAPGDVGAIIGQPGCGKSQVAPLLAYAVAQGRAVFGCRTKQGGTLYVAAEDFSGMRQRVHALKLAHADAPAFALVDCANLADEATRADLLDTVAAERLALVIIDTVGAAWAGLEENDAAGMGAVVALARRIAATGAAVILVHHTAKNGDGSPRGHSVLNGTLDMCLTLGAMGENRIIRGRLTKNRNGPCNLDIAFRTETTTLGADEDGDAITAPIACELPPQYNAPRRPKLSPREQRALDILVSLDSGEGVAENSWFMAAEDQGLISSDTASERRKVSARVLRLLLNKQAATFSGGVIHPVCEKLGRRQDSQGRAGTDL